MANITLRKPTLNEYAQHRLTEAGFTKIGSFWGKISDSPNSNAQRFVQEWCGVAKLYEIPIRHDDFRMEAGARNPYGTAQVFVGVRTELYEVLTNARNQQQRNAVLGRRRYAMFCR